MARLAALSALVIAMTAAPAFAAQAEPANPWLGKRVMNMAHSGGENEAPTNTMYAFKRARELGADMLELDVQSTKDGRLVVIHDGTVDRTTNGTGRVVDKTLAELRALDAAHWFVPGRGVVTGLPPESYPFRGVRTGHVPPPPESRRSDFAIPTLFEVLATFPRTPLNIEIKGTSDADVASYLRNAELLACVLKRLGREDIIVVSAVDQAVARFHELAPNVPIAPGMQALLAYFSAGVLPGPGVVALQVPVEFNGIPVATPEFIRRAHRDGFAVHVFMSAPPENEELYNRLIDSCADGIMVAFPTRLERVLDDRGIVRPGKPGVDPCA